MVRKSTGKGMLNKQIAAELGTSEITVKIQRGQVMHKMEAECEGNGANEERIWSLFKAQP